MKISPQMASVLDSTENDTSDTDYPDFIIPTYLKSEILIKELEDFQDLNSKEIQKIQKKNLKKNKNKKKDEIFSYPWCEIYSYDEVFSSKGIKRSNDDDGYFDRSQHEIKSILHTKDDNLIYRQSVPLFVIIIPYIDVLECLAEAFDITNEKRERTDRFVHSDTTSVGKNT